jgi:hypothetical protein
MDYTEVVLYGFLLLHPPPSSSSSGHFIYPILVISLSKE